MPRSPVDNNLPVGKLRNLGQASTRWLAAVGIFTRGDLERVGPATAFRMVQQVTDEPNLNFLYALEGALQGRGLLTLSSATKARLRRAASTR